MATCGMTLREQLQDTFCSGLVEEVVSIFTRQDVDGSGTISASEFQPLLAEVYLLTGTPVFEDMIHKEAESLLKEFDKNSDSALDPSEFCTMLKTSRLAKVLLEQDQSKWKPEAEDDFDETCINQGHLAELKKKSEEPVYRFSNGDTLFDVTLAGLEPEQEEQVPPMQLLEFPKPLLALGVLKYVERWARGPDTGLVEVKAVMVDDRETPIASRKAIGLLCAPQDCYSLADFLKTHNFKEGPVLVRHDAKLYASGSLAGTMNYLMKFLPYQHRSLDCFCASANTQDWKFKYHLRLRCTFSAEEYREGKVRRLPLMGAQENMNLLGDLVWLIHHFTLEEEEVAGTLAQYESKPFVPKEIDHGKVPLKGTRQVLEDLWTRRAANKVNMDHVVKKVFSQALELYSRIEH